MCLHTAARDNMLMRFAKVTPEGRYIPPPPANSKASFSTMVYVRATIVEEAGEYLARAVTIAVSLSRCMCSRTDSVNGIVTSICRIRGGLELNDRVECFTQH
jgi:hypothetical protein